MYATHSNPHGAGYNLGGINSTGQVNLLSLLKAQLSHAPQIPSIGNFGLIDLDTPKEAYNRYSYRDGSHMVLVFSDEFNEDGRTFYPGDDPYWEAENLHYWVCTVDIFRPRECAFYTSDRRPTTWSGTTPLL